MSNELPYEVYDCQGELVGAFPFEHLADDFVEDVCWLDGRKPLEIVGPGERGDSDTLADAQDVYRKAGVGPDGEAFDAPDPGTLRPVEVEADKPTLDQMPEWERHLCLSPNGNKVWMMSISGDAWYAHTPALHEAMQRRSEYIVLDAPAPQRTVRDLRPWDVVHDEDAGWLICQVPEGGTFWQISGSQAWKLPVDQTIDKVYRFEVAS